MVFILTNKNIFFLKSGKKSTFPIDVINFKELANFVNCETLLQSNLLSPLRASIRNRYTNENFA